MPRRAVFAGILSLGLAALPGAGAAGDTVVGGAPMRPELQRQALHFWQTVAAKPDDRASLLRAHISAGILQRKGEASLNETFTMLA